MGGVPSGFLPSALAKVISFDEEGRLQETRFNTREDAPGIAEANSLYATDAEMFGSIAPFLRVNRLKDVKRRNYIIQPGGAQIIFDGPPPVAMIPERRALMPSAQEQRGHNSYDGTKLAEPAGRPAGARRF